MTQINAIITKFNSIPIPSYLLYESFTRNIDLIFTWIQYRKNKLMRDGSHESRNDIPDELKYIDWKNDEDGRGMFPLVAWIKYRKNECICNELLEPHADVPEACKYANRTMFVEGFGMIPLPGWIMYRKNEPIPEELKYPGWTTSKTAMGKTLLMLWNQYRDGELIRDESLESQGDVRDESLESLESQGVIPEELN